MLMALVTGCTVLPERPWPMAGGGAVELADVPFFPQQAYQCGPAALATVLVASGVDITPDDLVPYVWLPERRGSLQPELLAQTRRHGRIPFLLADGPSELMAELEAGRPVLVLQNLGFDWAPVWHYAVVIGHDGAGNLVLRSGREERHVVAAATFARTWRRGGYWAFVVLVPGELPVASDVARYAQAVSAFARVAPVEQVIEAWRAGIGRWPGAAVLQIALGNTLHAAGDAAGAVVTFREAIARDPAHGVAWNNLALALADLGAWDEAEAAARRAVELGGQFVHEFEDTLARIRCRRDETCVRETP